MHLFCDVIIGITFRRNSVEMFNKISMNSKVVKYLDTKELSETFEEFKVKKNLVWERKFHGFLLVLISMTKKLLLLLTMKSIQRLVIKRSKNMVIFKLIVNKIETVQAAITTFEDALFEGLELHLVSGDTADPDQAVVYVVGQEFEGALVILMVILSSRFTGQSE